MEILVPKLYELCINYFKESGFQRRRTKMNRKTCNLISHEIVKDPEYAKCGSPDIFMTIMPDPMNYKSLYRTQLTIFTLDLPDTIMDVRSLHSFIKRHPYLANIRLYKIYCADEDMNFPFYLNNVTSFSLYNFSDPILFNSLIQTGYYNLKSLHLYSRLYKYHKEIPEFMSYILQSLPKLRKIDFDNVRIVNFLEFAENLNSPKLLTHFSYTNSHSIPHFSCDCIPLLKIATNIEFLDFSGCCLDYTLLANQFLTQPVKFLNIFNCDELDANSLLNSKKFVGKIGGSTSLTYIINSIFYFENKPELLIKALHLIERIPFPVKSCLNKRFFRFIIRLLNSHRNYNIINMIFNALMVRGSCQPPTPTYLWRIVKSVIPIFKQRDNDDLIAYYYGAILIEFEPWKCTLHIPNLSRVVLDLMECVNSRVLAAHNEKRFDTIINFAICESTPMVKAQLGSAGCIERALGYITNLLKIDDPSKFIRIEPWWSFLWNITDETEENVMLILKNDGLQLALSFFNKYPETDEIIRPIVGTIGNLAEVRKARPQIGVSGIIEQLFLLLQKPICFTFETFYNACGALCNLLSDSDHVLETYVYPVTPNMNPKDAILSTIGNLVVSWPIEMSRNINYRSLGPIVRLLNETSDERIWLWAIWACANLTTYDLKKYMSMLLSVNGLETIKFICSHPDLKLQYIHSLALVCINNNKRYFSDVGGCVE